MVLFGALTGDWHLVHTDTKCLKRTVFGARIAYGLLILAMGGGLMFRVGRHAVPSSTIALYGLDKAHVGEVISTGPAARDVAVGARVLVNPWASCGRCEHRLSLGSGW